MQNFFQLGLKRFFFNKIAKIAQQQGALPQMSFMMHLSSNFGVPRLGKIPHFETPNFC